MKITGIICEYNPLHNGHLYQIQQVRKNGAEAIVAVMSGNFMQRGDVAVMDKFTRAKLAVESGVDLVIELPVPYAVAPAEVFALGGVALLSALPNVTEISFGSEYGDLELLRQAADACYLCKTEYRDMMQDFLKQGHPYPEVLMHMVEQLYGTEVAEVLLEPNNTLAVEYLNAMHTLKSPLEPYTVQRRGAGHHSLLLGEERPEEGTAGIASATYIRNCIQNGVDCRRTVPEYCYQTLQEMEEAGQIADIQYLERILLYQLRTTSAENLRTIAEIGQGLEHRLYQARSATSLENLLEILQTKRYPLARLRRILIHVLLDIRKSDTKGLPPYGRILAFNDMGRQILRCSKDSRGIPFSHSLKELSKLNPAASRCASLDAKATDIFYLAMPEVGTAAMDYRRKTEPPKPMESAEEVPTA